MKIVFKFTHKGWFGVCPVYFMGIDTEGTVVEPRHWSLTPLMMFSEGLYWLVFRCCEAMSPTYQPEWPLMVTGELNPPVVHTREVKDAS